MSVTKFESKSVAVLISQPSLTILTRDGVKWVGQSTAYALEQHSDHVDSPLGGRCLTYPSYGVPTRPLTDEELAADVAVTTQLPGMISALRNAGFTGAIMAPGFYDAKLGGVRQEEMILLSPSVEQAERTKAVREEADRLIAEGVPPGAAAVRAVHAAIVKDHE